MLGLRVVVFESRKATEMARLVERHGGVPLTAPAMREEPLATAPEAIDLVSRLRGKTVDLLVLLTGVGTRALAKAVADHVSLDELVVLLRAVPVIARGPKPSAVLKEWRVPVAAPVPEPHTWREVLAAIDGRLDIAGKVVAVQEYGVSNERLYEGLRSRGASVLGVPVYRWAAPADPAPLRFALTELAARRVDCALFTSAHQVYSVFGAAKDEGLEQAVRAALGDMVVASVGPVCSEALVAHGVEVDLEPSHPKMGHLVQETAERAAEIRQRKRGSSA